MTSGEPASWNLPRLRVAPDGAWYHEDEEVTHEGILASLRDALEQDGSGFFIRVGPVRVPVEVEDAPVVVVRFEASAGGFAVVLNDGSRETLRPETLRLGPGEVPYCRVKDGRFEARFSRAAAYQLLRHVEPDETAGRCWLSAGGRRYVLGP